MITQATGDAAEHVRDTNVDTVLSTFQAGADLVFMEKELKLNLDYAPEQADPACSGFHNLNADERRLQCP
jgi:hypothetical protein